jgi:hypothetical protein
MCYCSPEDKENFMDISIVKSNECPICFNPFNNPQIHSGCGNTLDYQCMVDAVVAFGRCPICSANATVADFKPNVALRDVLGDTAELAVRVVETTRVVEITRPFPMTLAPSVNRGEKGFDRAMSKIKQLNRQVYKDHINKPGTKKVRADWGNQIIAIDKSRKWRFFNLIKGGGALYEGESFDAGVLALAHRV